MYKTFIKHQIKVFVHIKYTAKSALLWSETAQATFNLANRMLVYWRKKYSEIR